jgi:hypothetical protein
MFVRFLTGRRAGTVEEMKFADAQPLIADGRAERFVQGETPEVAAIAAPTMVTAKVVVTPKPKGKKKR